MQIEQKPTLLSKILKSKILILYFAGIIFLLSGILLYFELKLKKDDGFFLLNPVAEDVFRKVSDPLFEHVLSSKTTDNYPPNSYFPINLQPLYQDNIDIDVWAYAVLDRKTKQLLYERNLTEEYPVASLTKVMTAIVALENAPLDLEFTVSSYAASIGEATMGLTSGERLTNLELLYGVLLPSGNDATEALAEGIGKYKKGLPANSVDGGGARQYFLDEMNRKAQRLGMYDTYFFNPTGLDEEAKEESSFSTPLDLLALGNYALENPTFARIVATRFIQFPYEEGKHKAFYLNNILQLEESFSGIKGVKPGVSVFAKETLLSYAERDGREIIVVILGSNHTKDDVIKIYERVFGG